MEAIPTIDSMVSKAVGSLTVVFFGGEKTEQTFFWKPGSPEKVPSVFHALWRPGSRLATHMEPLGDPYGAPWRPEISGEKPKIGQGAPIDLSLIHISEPTRPY